MGSVRAATTVDPQRDDAWCWPVDLVGYDRRPGLAEAERLALAEIQCRRSGERRAGSWPDRLSRNLERLLPPLGDVFALTGADERRRTAATGALVTAMHERGAAYWGWTRADWLAVLRANNTQQRQDLLAVAYLLCGQHDLHAELRGTMRHLLAARVFGVTRFDAAVARVREEVRHWGYAAWLCDRELPNAVGAILLVARSPRLADVTPAAVAAVLAADPPAYLRTAVRVVARALVKLGLLASAPTGARASAEPPEDEGAPAGVPGEWAAWARRWRETSTLTSKVRRIYWYYLLRAGRWLAATHPAVVTPAQWTRALAAEYVAVVDRMVVGDWSDAPTYPLPGRVGQPLSPSTKDKLLGALRVSFRDAQEWGWLPRAFDPGRAFATPRTVKALLGPSPRVIADDIWAKLLWAGLNLAFDDLPALYRGLGTPYPLAMLRAVTLVWLFTGLRCDEIRRLRVGCVRWQHGDAVVAGTAEVLSREAVCWLDVPANKTSTAFTKAVDRAVGEAIEVWERERPTQLPAADRKTGEVVQFLFAYRGRQFGQAYLNDRLIPALCAKGGVPTSDARGAITSHRARSTIASQLANAREPLTLLELMEWLGHRHPGTTLHYVKVAPTKLAKAYADAGYFARNLRAVEVLIDREVVESGAAANGEPWRFYDLGHGYCTYQFFDQCPHRMACAKCAFYRPKGSSQAQLLEGRANLLRLKQELPLLEDERAAVDDGVEALEQLLARLADTPTPDGGPPPRERGLCALPVLPAR